MSAYLRLAELLEEAAAKLREADKSLNDLPPKSGTPLNTLVGWGDLPARCKNIIDSNGVYTVEALVGLTPTEVFSFRNMGMMSMRAVREMLKGNGLFLNGDGADRWETPLRK